MKKKRFIAIILFFIFLTFLEAGIFLEVVWHGWGGFGDISMEYTEEGSTGISFLIFFIPVIVIVIFLVRIVLCIKRINTVKGLLFDCIFALLGVGMGSVVYFIIPDSVPYNPIFLLGRQIASFFIDHFNWMEYPMP